MKWNVEKVAASNARFRYKVMQGKTMVFSGELYQCTRAAAAHNAALDGADAA